MSKGLQLKTCFVGLLLAFVMAIGPSLVMAQETAPPPKREFRLPTPPQGPTIAKPPSQAIKPAGTPLYQRYDSQLGRVSLPVARGVRLRVENRTPGRISIHGWDRDIIEAHAISERGDEVVIVGQTDDNGPKGIFLKADYANLNTPETPTLSPEMPPLNNDGPIHVHLEVNVPRYAEFEMVKVIRTNVEITGVETPLIIISQQSNITLKDVGSVEVHNRTGSIIVENARGIADLSTSTGSIRVTNSRGAVRAVSIAGPIDVRCVKGRVDVGNTQAPIELVGIDGDVEVIAASSNIRFTGPLSSDGRYHMKSMTGRVEMIVPADTPGFNATLTSYRGPVESDFSLLPKPTAQDSETAGHRLSGRFGSGSPQITLDSFDGLVKLTRVGSLSLTSCR